jgi:hypothetical protein
MQKHGAHNKAFDAFELAEEPPTYDKDMCPVTLDVLSRTAYLYTDPERSREELDAMIDKVRRVAAQL